MLEFVISIILKQFFILGANPIITLNMKEKGGMRSNKWINDWWSFFKMKQRWNTSQRINFLTGFFHIIPLLLLQKSLSLYRQNFWELLITNIHQMIFFVTKKRSNLSGFIFMQLFWNHKIKVFRSPLNFINYSISNSELPIANGVLSST